MGQVWRARDTSLQRTVAVKVVDVSTTDDPTMLERFRREAIATAGLSHPNIVLVYDAGFDQETAFLVMELLTGPSLQHLVREQGALPLDLGIRVAIEVARGLQAAHRIGVIHRDVKPGNVMFHHPEGHLGPDTGRFGGPEATTQAFGANTGQQTTPFAPPGQAPAYAAGQGLDTSGAVKLVDFGIAQLSQNSGATLTAPATALGTAAYMAPEQASGTGASTASDWYALGCLMMTIFTGKAPFTGDTFAVAAQQITTEPPRLSDRRPDLPPALDDLIAAMLAKEPAHRPDGETILTQLRALAADPNAPTMAMGAVGGGTRAMPATAVAPAFPATPSDAYDDEYADEDEYGDDLEQAEDDRARKRGKGAVVFLVACILFAVIAVAGAFMLRDRNKVVPVDPQATPSTSAPTSTEPATTKPPETTKAPATTKAPPTKAPQTSKPPQTTKAPEPTTTKPQPTSTSTGQDDDNSGNQNNGNSGDDGDESAGRAMADAVKATLKLKDGQARSQMRQALTEYASGSASSEDLANTASDLAEQGKLSESEAKQLRKAFSQLPR